MNADRAEVSWDASKNKWLVRLIVGEEVIRRHTDQPQNADPATLTAAAIKTAADEGYILDSANISVSASGPNAVA